MFLAGVLGSRSRIGVLNADGGPSMILEFWWIVLCCPGDLRENNPTILLSPEVLVCSEARMCLGGGPGLTGLVDSISEDAIRSDKLAPRSLLLRLASLLSW